MSPSATGCRAPTRSARVERGGRVDEFDRRPAGIRRSRTVSSGGASLDGCAPSRSPTSRSKWRRAKWAPRRPDPSALRHPTRSCSSTACAGSKHVRGSRSPRPTRCPASSRRTPRVRSAATARRDVEDDRRSAAGSSRPPAASTTSRPVTARSSRATPRTPRPEAINYAVHERMTECEVRIAERTRECRERPHRARRAAAQGSTHPRCVGLVKTHHVRYLPERLNPVVGALAAGERTPVFRIDARPFSRHSWYLRLPGPPGGPWAGIVRCEASGTLPVAATSRRLADTVTRRAPPLRVGAAQGSTRAAEPGADRRARATAAAPARRRAGVVSRAPCCELGAPACVLRRRH